MLPFSLRTALYCSLFTQLIACGGGGGGGNDYAGIDGSGAPAMATVSGPINGFGSVIVNGVHYNTEQAEFWVRGKLASEAALSVGSYIYLEGYVDTEGKEGVAKRVYFQPNATGAISSINVAENTFTVLGQTVHISSDTMFDFGISPRSINGLTLGEDVEISGPLNAYGEIMATRINLAPTAATELTGTISNLNTETKTFMINGITVDFGQVPFLPQLENGQPVIMRNGHVENKFLQPEEITLSPKPQITQGQWITQTGLITQFSSLQDFSLDTLNITTDNHTEYLGASANQMGLNKKITVVGHMQNGQLLADKIQFIADAQWKIQGLIDDMRNMSLGGGEILVQGSWIQLAQATRLDSELSGFGHRMKYPNLRPHDFVVITGHQDGNSKIADSLEREETGMVNSETKIQGTVNKQPITTDAHVFFLDSNIEIHSDENTQFFNQNMPISLEEFNRQAPGMNTAIDGVFIGDGLMQIFKAINIQLIPTRDNNDHPEPIIQPFFDPKHH